MEGIKNYIDLVQEIKETELCYNSNQINYKYYLSVYKQGPKLYTEIILDGMPKGSTNRMTLDYIIEKLNIFDTIMQQQQTKLEDLQQLKKAFDDYITVNKGLKYLVIQLYYVEGKGLDEIANILNYSYNYIRHISSNVNKGLRLNDTIKAP